MNISTFIPKYIRQTVADITRKVITHERWNELWNLAIQQGDWNAEGVDSLCKDAVRHQTSADHDTRYYTKTEVNEYLRGGDTIILEEVFTVLNGNLGDGTFSYKDINDVTHIGDLTVEGYQIFTLQDGGFTPGMNTIELIVGDTLRRSVKSGGLLELGTDRVILTAPVGNDTEITVKYFQKLGLSGTGLIVVSNIAPTIDATWFEVVG